MSLVKTITVEANTEKAKKEIESLNKEVNKLDKSVEDVGGDKLNNLSKGADKSTKSVGGLSGGFKGLGLAIKATGIGLLVTLLAKLVEELGKNERVAKFFRIATEALSIVIQDFINFIIDNSGTVVDTFKAIFEDPLGSIEKLGQLIKDNLIERFNSLIEVTGFLSDAFSKLFEGDFQGAFDSLKEAGKEAIDVYTGVDDTVGKVKKGFQNAAEGISNYASKVLDAASKTIELQDAAIIAAAEQARLVEQYDREAELLRQIRDNDLKSIDDRIKANNELKRVLDEQQKAQLKQADLQIAAARVEAERNQSAETRAAVIDAIANKEGILAQIEGFRSEQETNRIALEKERLALNQSRIDGETERALKEKQFAAEQENDTLKQLQLQRDVLEQEKIIEEERLQNKIDSFALGTQARVDAENELENRLQEIRFASLENQKAIADEEQRIKKESDEKELQREKVLADNKKALIADGLQTVQGLLKKNSAASKALAAAQTIFDTQQGITSALAAKSPSDQLLPFPVRLANAALVGVKGALALKNILKTNPENGLSGAPSTDGVAAAAPAPAFNLIGQAGGINQIQESLEQEQQPIQAFVVSGNVTSAQELDRNIIESASL